MARQAPGRRVGAFLDDCLCLSDPNATAARRTAPGRNGERYGIVAHSETQSAPADSDSVGPNGFASHDLRRREVWFKTIHRRDAEN